MNMFKVLITLICGLVMVASLAMAVLIVATVVLHPALWPALILAVLSTALGLITICVWGMAMTMD
jgi:hypothetical protein